MLTFFRKYQKGFFVVITGVIVISFVFFGGAGVASKTVTIKEEPLFKSLSGSVVTKQKVERMMHFISFSHLDFTDDRITSPNWLNDGVLEKDFLGAPLGALLAEKIFPSMQEEISSIVKEARSFRSYQHPGAPFLTAEAVWGQFAPDSLRNAALVVNHIDAVTPKTFEALSAACLGAKSFPSVFLKRVLLYQENQDARIRPDSGLSQADVSLLGLHSLQNWVGPTYLKAAAEVILNGSAFAESRGFSMSLADARMELLSNLQDAAKRVSKEISPKELYAVFLEQVRRMGLEEMECVSLWRDIALFRKLFHSVTIDPSLLKEFYAHAKKQATVELFSLPAELQCKDLSAILKLHLYIQAVSLPKVQKHILAFPKEFLSLNEIEKKTPELVRQEYVLSYAELDIKKASSQIGLKETWSWETSDAGWALLRKQFPEIAKKEISVKEERFSLLDALDDALRLEVDKFAREKILVSDVDRVKELLAQQPRINHSCLLSEKGDGLPFKEIKDKIRLMALLGNEEALSFYTEDNQHYYTISVGEGVSDKKILTYKEAEESGALKQMLDKKLEAIYPEVRKKDSISYMQKGGGWEPLAKVKDKVAMALFPELLKAIQVEYTSFYGKDVSLEEKNSPAFYVQNRMIFPLKEALQSQEISSHELAKQWGLLREVRTEWKSNKELFPQESIFNLKEGDLSPITVTRSGNGWFFRMLGHSEASEAPADEEEAAIAPLRKEEKRKLSLDLLNAIEEKGALKL